MDAMDSPSMVDEFQDGWGFLGQSAWNRVMKAIEVGIVGFFRQSTMRQAKLHVGSQQVQEEQLVHLEPFGVTREDVRVILAYGESGRAGVVRKRFEELRRLVEAGQVGLVVLAKHDRLSRNSDDADALYRAMRDHGTLVMVDGRIYDPNDAGDDFVLTMYAKFAEWENRARTRWLSMTRYAKARSLRFKVALPTGLAWADPEDPECRAAFEAAGLLDRLADLSAHRVVVEEDGKKLYPLPFPDREVYRAIVLAVNWLLETGDLTTVEERIATGYGEWPRPGELPATKGQFSYKSGEKVRWRRVTRERVYNLLCSRALYGTYRYVARSLAQPGGPGGRRARVRVQEDARLEWRVDDAFPSYFSQAEYRRVREILSSPGRGWVKAGPPSEFHAVHRARCMAPGVAERSCARIVRPWLRAPGNHEYVGIGCPTSSRPHMSRIPGAELDEQVIGMLLEVFSAERLEAAALGFRVDFRALDVERRRLEEARSDREAKRNSASERALTAMVESRKARDHGDVTKAVNMAAVAEHWEDEVARLTLEIRRLDQEIRQSRLSAEEYRDVAASDLERIVALATDLPALIERARAVPYALQRITHALVEGVRVWRIGRGAFQVQLDFPGGQSIGRIFRAVQFDCSQPQRVWAYHRLGAGVAPEEVGREIYEASGSNEVSKWRAADVQGAAAIHEHLENEPERTGTHWSVAELAARMGEDTAAVLKMLMRGRLGPARWDGQILLQPTEAELQYAFPEYALREVARKQHLEPDDLVPLGSVRRSVPAAANRKDVRRWRDQAGRVYVLRSQAAELGWSPDAVDPVREALRAAVEEAVLREHGPEADPNRFMSLNDAAARLCGRFVFVSRERLRKAIDRGRVRAVSVHGVTSHGRRRARPFIFLEVPEAVMAATEAEVVRGWLWKDGIPPAGTYGRLGRGVRRPRVRRPRTRNIGTHGIGG